MKNTTRDRALISGLKGSVINISHKYLIKINVLMLVLLPFFPIILYFDEPIGQASQNVNNG